MLSVKWHFVDGVAKPVEPIEGYDQEEVIITFLRGEDEAAQRPSWSEAEGMFSYPMMGEYAQAWVTRTRRDGDEHRERLLRREIPQNNPQDEK